jgi:hypothetical protein
MRLYSIDSSAMINREKIINPADRPKQLASGRAKAGRTKKVQALMERLKREGW